MPGRRVAIVVLAAAALLFRCGTAAGQIWTPAGTPPEASLVRDIAIAPTPSRTVYIAATANLGIVSRLYGGIFRKVGGAAFERARRDSGASSLSVDPRDPSVVYAAAGTVVATVDGGATWASDPFPPASVVLATPDGSLFAGSASGVYRRRVVTGAWEKAVAPFSPARMAVDPRNPSTIYAAAQPDLEAPFRPGGVFRSTDGGAVFLRVGNPEVGSDADAVVVDPISSGNVYVAAGACVFRSVDGGDHWLERSAGLPGTPVLSLAIDPARPWILYAGTRGSGVFRTADAGATWSSLNDGLPGAGFGAPDIYALSIDQASLTLYCGTDGFGVYTLETGTLAVGCVSNPSTLCLGDGRFSVSVDFDSPFGRGTGRAIPLSVNAGAFWFLSENNVELVLKILDGRPVNGRYWVFLGSLSDLEYTVTVTDLATGATRSYSNPRGRLASVADTSAF